MINMDGIEKTREFPNKFILKKLFEIVEKINKQLCFTIFFLQKPKQTIVSM